MVSKKTVILGVSGGIAAVKAPQLVQLLEKQGLVVEVVPTKNAQKFVNFPARELFPKNFDAQKVLTSRKVEHIALADSVDLILIAPATANLIAKLAHGLADDFLTTTILATKVPVMVCPAMNVNMWQHPAVKANLGRLETLGYEIIPPVSGMLACGYEGLGRLEDIAKIAAIVKERLDKMGSLAGKKILITAGPTREPIDSVRFITNASSGKMGAAIALSASRRGAAVKLLMGQKDYVTAKDLLVLVKKYAPRFEIMFHAAAVGDFSPERSRRGKLSSKKPLNLRLLPQPKILEQIKKFNPKICLIGFKAEYGKKNKFSVQKGAEATVYNEVTAMGADDNEVVVVLPGKIIKLVKAAKAAVAERLLDELSRFYHW